MSIVLKNNVVFKNNIFTNEKIIRLKSSIQNVRKKKNHDRFHTCILSVSIVRSDDDDRDGKKSTGM